MGLRGRRLLAGVLSLVAAALAAVYAVGKYGVLGINQTYHPETVGLLDHLACAVPAAVAFIALALGLLFIFRSWKPDR
ncbi:MAG: hypothetical protein Q8L23_03850 [Caulobacter sp.]|nr:hypothetical protein [Caulobacter sp.]